MRGQNTGDALPFAANQNNEGVTIEAIQRDPWNAVDRSLPEDADRTLLERTAFAARECAAAAFAAARVTDIVEPDLAPAFRQRGEEASARHVEARGELSLLPAEQVAKVSPFLDPKEVLEKALRTVMIEVIDEAHAPRPAVTDAAIDVNPWSIIRSDLSGADPELLLRAQATALGLVREASDWRDRSRSPAEASLWDAFADMARNTYAEAECELVLGAVERGDLEPAVIGMPPPVIESDKDRAALVDLLGEETYRAVNEPIPGDATVPALLELSDQLNAALDWLDALNRNGAAGISPDFIAGQYGKAAARQDEVETRLADMDREIDRDQSAIGAATEIEDPIYERYPGLTREDDEPERGPGRGR